MKPIAVYGPALDQKIITPGSIFNDEPVYLNKNSTDPYPLNYDKSFSGLMAIRDAVRNSINVVAAQVWQKVGADQSLKYLKRSGIELDKKKDGFLAPLALGALTDGLAPIQLAGAYIPFANKGMYYQPVTYTKVLDAKGNVLLENKPKSTVVYDDERAAYLMTNILQDVVTNGTAYPYGIIKNSKGEVIPTAGKTGTTSDNKDKWFVGFSTKYVAATWYGYPTPTVLKESEYNNALKIWNAVMTKVLANAKPEEFTRPSKIVEKNICLESGKLATEYCVLGTKGQEEIRYGELFIEGTEPKETCDIHLKPKVEETPKPTISPTPSTSPTPTPGAGTKTDNSKNGGKDNGKTTTNSQATPTPTATPQTDSSGNLIKNVFDKITQ
jgi:Membrane carboxypeptidase/penicillin-binding protein